MDTLSLSRGKVSVIVTKSGHGRKSQQLESRRALSLSDILFGASVPKKICSFSHSQTLQKGRGVFLSPPFLREQAYSLSSRWNRWLALWTWNHSNFRTARMLQIRWSPTQRCMWNPRILYRMRHFRDLSGMPTKRMVRETGVRNTKDRISYISVWMVTLSQY